MAPRSPTPEISTLAGTQAKILPVFELKEGTRFPWKLGKEAPRFSLDSRAIVNAKGNLQPKTSVAVLTQSDDSEMDDGDEKRRSTSVIARLMGLEPFTDSAPEPVKKAELRRSASESRVPKDLSRFIDSNNLQLKQSVQPKLPKNAKTEIVKKEKKASSCSSRPWKLPQHRKSYFDSEDFFPEPKENMSIYNEIERRLRMRGIDKPCKDLEMLKQILEAMQLKGLLHNERPSDRRNYVYVEESPIVLMKPTRSRAPPTIQWSGNAKSGDRLSGREGFLSASPRHRNTSSPNRRESSAKSSPNSSPVRRRSPTDETQRRTNEFPDPRRTSSVHSPMRSPRRTVLDRTMANQSRRNKRMTVDAKEKIAFILEDESSSISESTVSTSSLTDTERSKMEEYKGGRCLLDRCDKLLHSIAEMTATELQPSPVSVLDSSFYKDDSSSPWPITRRSINFKDQCGEYEDIWNPGFSPIQSESEDKIQDCDYVYISDILRTCNCLPGDADMFILLEKQQYLKGNDTSKVSRLQRKLIFDTIGEILDRDRRLPPWKLPLQSNSAKEKLSLSHIWSEFQRIRERDSAQEDLFDTICGVLRKDLAGDAINGWGDCHVEMSEAVLDIERMIFKDLVGETIHDLATLGGNNMVYAPRRKLVF